MSTTEQLIEKYKAEMQKMISNARPQNSLLDTSPAIKEPPDEMGSIQEETTQPELPSQDFPGFEADKEELTRRIEEILLENSDVAENRDLPSNLQETYPADNIPTEPLTGQGDLIMQDDNIVIENLNSLDEQQKKQIYPPIFTPDSSNLRPKFSTAQQPPTQPPSVIQPREVSFEDMAPPLMQQEQSNENDNAETPGQIVSRVCIRGGAKAQYSPPANTGLALGTDGQTVPALSDIGNLRVEVFAANRAIPIANAMIRVRNMDNNELVAVLVTNSSGNTTRFELPAPDRSLSTQPGSVHPFVNYLVDIRADGYIPQSDLRVQMFGGIESILPVNMIPLKA